MKLGVSRWIQQWNAHKPNVFWNWTNRKQSAANLFIYYFCIEEEPSPTEDLSNVHVVFVLKSAEFVSAESIIQNLLCAVGGGRDVDTYDADKNDSSLLLDCLPKITLCLLEAEVSSVRLSISWCGRTCTCFWVVFPCKSQVLKTSLRGTVGRQQCHSKKWIKIITKDSKISQKKIVGFCKRLDFV